MLEGREDGKDQRGKTTKRSGCVDDVWLGADRERWEWHSCIIFTMDENTPNGIENVLISQSHFLGNSL